MEPMGIPETAPGESSNDQEFALEEGVRFDDPEEALFWGISRRLCMAYTWTVIVHE